MPLKVGVNEDSRQVGTYKADTRHRVTVVATLVDRVEDGAVALLDGDTSVIVSPEDVDEVSILGKHRCPGDAVAYVPGGFERLDKFVQGAFFRRHDLAPLSSVEQLPLQVL